MLRRLTLCYAFDERFVYKLEQKNVARRISRHDFIIPNYKLPNKGVEFNHFRLFCQNAPSQNKNEIVLPCNKVGYNMQTNNCKGKNACPKPRKKDEKIYFDQRKKLNLLQEP